MNIEMYELRQLLTTAASIASKATLIRAGLEKTEITKAEAYRRYTRRDVDEWVAAQLIKPITRGKKVRLLVAELDVLSKTKELHQKLTCKIS